jgi:hypothetical protein
MFDTNSDETSKVLDKGTLKALGMLPRVVRLPEAPLPEAELEVEELAAPIIEAKAEVDPAHDELSNEQDAASLPTRRSTRVSNPPFVQTNQKYRIKGETPAAFLAEAKINAPQMVTETTLEEITPKSAYHALHCAQKDMWLEAMKREKLCHIKNGTFGANMPASCSIKPVPVDWIFKIKYRGGPIDVAMLMPKQYKARVVVRGQHMREGINFHDTFAPVAKQTTIRAVLAYATKHGYLLKAGDVETAFLTAAMDCEAYVKMPPYWGESNEDVDMSNPQIAAKLLVKGVPGIPQGSRLFNQTFTDHMKTLGFVPTHADSCLFINPTLKEANALILFVDDFIFLHESERVFNEFMNGVRKKFNVPSTGPLQSFLGIEITYRPSKRFMLLQQKNSINVLLERAGLSNANSVSTPCPNGFVFTKQDCPLEEDKNATEYRSLIAMANYIACWTRPDLSYTVNKLCKYMANPGQPHWRILKHMLRYLVGTKELGLIYDFADDKKLKGLYGFTDASYADCIDTSRSTLAYCFFYYGAMLSWYSKHNSYVTTSTNHSEYAALALGAREAEWQILLFASLSPSATFTPIPIYVDNSGIVSMVFNAIDHKSNKHIRINCHYSRELYEAKLIVPIRVASEANLADVFTKALPKPAFVELTRNFIAPLPTGTASALMMHARNLDEEPNHSPSTPPRRYEPQTPPRTSNFLKDWPYVSTVRTELGAAEHEVVEMAEYFSTGRRKYQAIFFDEDHKEISRHLAMRLINNSTGSAYMVCKREPLRPRPAHLHVQPHAPVTTSVHTHAPALAPVSTIVVKPPKPTLTCLGCAMNHTVDYSMISCSNCMGHNFEWSCGCQAAQAVKASATTTMATTMATTAMAHTTTAHTPATRVSIESWLGP